MTDTLKKSKFNYYVFNNNGDLLLYNFFSGLSSLSRIAKEDVNAFSEFILKKEIIPHTTADKYKGVISHLIDNGLLVDSDINENILYYSTQFNEIFDNVLRLTIFPTGKCNFKCAYCFENTQTFCRETMSAEAQAVLLKFVQKSIANHKALHVSWFGGEPLLAPEVISYLSNGFRRICDSRHLSYSADITTNGFLLDHDMFDKLYELGVYKYYITLDGVKEQHDKRRFTKIGNGTFDKIVSNLIRIKNNRQYRFAKISIRVNMSQGFFEHSDEFLNYLSNNFADDPRFEFTFVPVVKFSGSDFPDEYVFHDYSSVFERLNKNEVYVSKLLPKEYHMASIIRQPKCPSALKNSYVITPDLKVYKCNAHYDFEANTLGKIEKKGDLVINESLHRKWYLTRRLLQEVPEDCEKCCYMPCCVFIDSSCPVSFLRDTPDEYHCWLKNENLKADIDKTILFAAQTCACETLVF